MYLIRLGSAFFLPFLLLESAVVSFACVFLILTSRLLLQLRACRFLGFLSTVPPSASLKTSRIGTYIHFHGDLSVFNAFY